MVVFAVPSSATLIFDEPLHGSTSGTTNNVTLQPSDARLTAADSWIRFGGPEIPATAGTLSLRLYIEPGATDAMVVSDGFKRPDDTVWPAFMVRVSYNAGEGKYDLGFRYWSSTHPGNWHTVDSAGELDASSWSRVGVTWGIQDASHKGQSIWVDGVQVASDPTYTLPYHEGVAGSVFETWGLGQVYTHPSAFWPTAHPIRVADVKLYDTFEDQADTQHSPPVLAWDGRSGYASDGCDPEAGQYPLQKFTFRAKISDVDGDEPTYCRMVIERDGNLWRTFNMRRGGGSPVTGISYRFARKLPPGDFRYRFEAGDWDSPATGTPTQWVDGPSVVPRLNQRPDGAIWNGLKWIGDNYYNTTAGKQRVNGEIAAGGSVDYTVRVENDSQAADTLRVKGTASRGDWTIACLTSGGADITADVTGAGWTPPALPGRASTEMTARVTVAAGADPGSQKAVVVQVGRAAWGPGNYATKADTVKMVTTVEGAASTGAMHITGLMAVPTSMGAQVQYALSSAAQVDARVLNIAGRPIRTLCTARDCKAGTNRLIWNAQADNGLRVPNGQYLVELLARTPDGALARRLTQVRIDR